MLVEERCEETARSISFVFRQIVESRRLLLAQSAARPIAGSLRQSAKWLRFCVLLFFGSLVLTLWAGAVQFESKNVLVLYSHEREMATYALLDKGLRSELESASRTPVTLYTEYLDLMRFPDENQKKTLVKYLRIKYSSRKIDLIFVVSPLALNFVIENANALFPATPVVFASVNIRTLQQLTLRPNITGVAVKRDVRDTLDDALRLQPDTTNVIVPSGTSQLERSWTEGLRNSLRPYEDRLTITYLSDLPMDSLLQRLKNLPPHTIVLFSALFFHDAAGQYFLPDDALDLICRSSNSPVYSTDRSFMGTGIVGGHLYDLSKVGAAAGKMGHRILAGEDLAHIPVQTLDPNYDMFDARQLKRWGISQARLPPGSIVQFSEPSFWALYERYVLACVAVFLVQSFLVIALIRQARRLKQSESRLQDLSRHLITAQEEERKRIARDLHDDFSQRLALLRIEIGLAAEEQQGQTSIDRARLSNLCSTVDDLTEDIRLLSHSLHSSKLQYLGLKAALKDLCGQIAKGHPMSVEFQGDDLGQTVPAEVALCLYRVAQEALNNAVKYSGASRVVVALSNGGSRVGMRITDSGKGFDPSRASGGLGLASMYERLRLVNGELRVSSKPGRGTELIAQVILTQSNQPSKAN
jgi:signal transduction histidine kinase